MKNLLFIIVTDPRHSHRPAEAVRIAVGVSVWRRAAITLYLRGAATLMLGDSQDELIDGEVFTRHLPAVRDFGRPIYVQRGTSRPAAAAEAQTAFEIKEIEDAQLAGLAAESDCVLRF